MKQLLSLLVVMSMFLVLGAGNASADEPKWDNYSPHTVWGDWFDKEGGRISENFGAMDENQDTARTVSTESMDKGDLSTDTKEFDFLRETQTYDHSKDQVNAS